MGFFKFLWVLRGIPPLPVGGVGCGCLTIVDGCFCSVYGMIKRFPVWSSGPYRERNDCLLFYGMVLRDDQKGIS